MERWESKKKTGERRSDRYELKRKTGERDRERERA